MLNESPVSIGEEFNPAPQFKKLYYIYLFLVFIIGILPWYLPTVVLLLLFAPPSISLIVTLIFSILILVPLVITVYWIPKYYKSIIYKLTTNEMEWRRGVWFKKTGIVPYNRITNVDIAQGPVSRMLGIASLKIQTAGYSGAPSRGYGGFAEIRIDGMEQFEEIREMIMSFVRGRKPVAVETYEEEDINLKILNELVKIRKLLAKS